MPPSRNLTSLVSASGARNPLAYGHFDDPFIDELAKSLKHKRVLEIFAGNGLLSSLLSQRDVSIHATSIFSSHDGHEMGLNYPVTEMDAVSAVLNHGAECDVLLVCWPTVTNAVLKAAEAWGPDKDIVFIGEITDYAKGHLGGCADDAFFNAVEIVSAFSTYSGNLIEQAVVMRLHKSVGDGT